MPTSLWRAWLDTAAAHPEAPAAVEADTGETWTCSALSRHAEVLAAGAPDPFAAGQTVAFCERNGANWLAMFLALQRLGAIVLPMDTALPPAGRPGAAAALGAHWLWEDFPDVWRRLETDVPPARPEEDFCLVKTTSGSTGEPRPLRFTGANMLADSRQIAATMEIGPGDVNLGAIPFGHSYGLGNLVLPLIAQGTAVVCSTEILPDALAAQIERHHATVLPSVPAVLRALAESSVDAARLRTLQRVISAGAPLRPAAAAAFRARFGVPIRNFYGSSETGGVCFDRTGEAGTTAAEEGGGISVGQPLEGVSVSLDEEGRVTVRGAAVMGTGEHTLADLGTWNARGELVLTGRATPLANIGGKKVSPAGIERALRALDGVTDAWVGVQTRPGVVGGGEDFLLAAVESARPGEALRRELAERVPAWQLPRRWWVAAGLPRTTRGKLDRRELEAYFQTGESAGGS